MSNVIHVIDSKLISIGSALSKQYLDWNSDLWSASKPNLDFALSVFQFILFSFVAFQFLSFIGGPILFNIALLLWSSVILYSDFRTGKDVSILNRNVPNFIIFFITTLWLMEG